MRRLLDMSQIKAALPCSSHDLIIFGTLKKIKLLQPPPPPDFGFTKENSWKRVKSKLGNPSKGWVFIISMAL